jgi:hypothetical protein
VKICRKKQILCLAEKYFIFYYIIVFLVGVVAHQNSFVLAFVSAITS